MKNARMQTIHTTKVSGRIDEHLGLWKWQRTVPGKGSFPATEVHQSGTFCGRRDEVLKEAIKRGASPLDGWDLVAA